VRGVALGGCGEAEDRVDVKHPAPLALESPDEQRGADAVTTDCLVRPTVKPSPPVGGGAVPLTRSDRIDAATQEATMPMVA